MHFCCSTKIGTKRRSSNPRCLQHYHRNVVYNACLYERYLIEVHTRKPSVPYDDQSYPWWSRNKSPVHSMKILTRLNFIGCDVDIMIQCYGVVKNLKQFYQPSSLANLRHRSTGQMSSDFHSISIQYEVRARNTVANDKWRKWCLHWLHSHCHRTCSAHPHHGLNKQAATSRSTETCESRRNEELISASVRSTEDGGRVGELSKGSRSCIDVGEMNLKVAQLVYKVAASPLYHVRLLSEPHPQTNDH